MFSFANCWDMGRRFSFSSISFVVAGGAAIQSICILGFIFLIWFAISMSLIMWPSPRDPLMNSILVNGIL